MDKEYNSRKKNKAVKSVMMKNKIQSSWQAAVSSAITSPFDPDGKALPDAKDMATVIQHYPMRIPSYFLNLATTSSAISKQVIPDIVELNEDGLEEDPLDENRQSPVCGLIHRYPDRVLFLVSSQCAVYCRYCMRKRMVGRSFTVNDETRRQALAYIKKTPSVHEVILSGGDPLMLETDKISRILKSLYDMDHIQIIRIHTRMPGVLPDRITDRLVNMLGQYPPLFLNIQFNHPDEITKEVKTACARLADAGIPLGSQTVLLKGINDEPEIMLQLMRRLLSIRVRPYYLHHPDVIRGTGHFRTNTASGLNIMDHLRGRISGMGIPQYVIDLPGGGGKVALLPESVQGMDDGHLIVKGLDGKMFRYPAG